MRRRPEFPDPACSRRDFNRWLAAGALGGLLGCRDDGRYSEADAQALRDQQQRERETSGQGPDGAQVYRTYRDLAELPWYAIDGRGRLVCRDETLPQALDFHVHLGISVLLAPELDLLARTPRVEHLLDCNGDEPGCHLDLDVYINAAFDAQHHARLERSSLSQGLWGGGPAATHTIPNLLDEMDDCRIAQALILPIKLGLPLDDDLSERWRAAIERAGSGERLLAGCSVHPRDDGALEQLRAHAAAGARILKLHPAMQRFYPDAPEAMRLYAECGRLGLPVILHAGRAGIEPEPLHRYTMMRNYEPMLRRFPDVRFVFAHGGARDVADAIPLAQRYPNAWLELHGQGVGVLREILARVPVERLLFGSDWPFYHQAASQAKILLVTEGRPEARHAILRGNADALLGLRA